MAFVLALVSAALPCLALDLPAENIWKVLVSPDGSRAVCAYRDGKIGVFDLASGDLIGLMKGHKDRANGLAFSPDMTMAASSDSNKTVILWDLAAMKKKASIKCGSEAYSLAFSPDGKYLAMVVKGGGEVYELGVKPKQIGKFTYYSQAERLDTRNFDFADQQIYRSIAFNADSSLVLAAKMYSARLHFRIGEPKADYRASGAYAAPCLLLDSPDTFATMILEKRSGDASKQGVTVSFHTVADGSVVGEPVTFELGAGKVEDKGISPSGAIAWFDTKNKEGILSLELFRLDGSGLIASIPTPNPTRCVCFSEKDSIFWYCDAETDILTKVNLADGSTIASFKLSAK